MDEMKNMNFFAQEPAGVEDLTHLDWKVARSSSGTAGMFLKAYEEVDGIKYYYKMSNYDSIRGIYGHEAVNEIVARNIANILDIHVLQYEPVKCLVSINNKNYITLVTRSRDFKNTEENKITLETFYDLHSKGEDIVEMFNKIDLGDFLSEMVLLDWLIYNRDRHGANVEVLVSGNGFRMAPLFDHGCSLIFSCFTKEQMDSFDKLAHNPVNNYVGSNDLLQNLSIVNKSVQRRLLSCEFTKKAVFKDLDDIDEFVPNGYKENVFNMVSGRAEYAKKIFIRES